MIGGMKLPVEEWKKVLDEMNKRTAKLEEDYEGTCFQKKVCFNGLFLMLIPKSAWKTPQCKGNHMSNEYSCKY